MYTQQYQILATEIDANFNVRPSTILRYMQETANRHMQYAKPSYRELFEQGKAFILSRINIEIYAQLHDYDIITVDTWPTNKEVTFLRSYVVSRGNELIAQGTGTWALVDIATKRLCRSDEVDLSSYIEQEELQATCHKRATIPYNEQLTKRGSFEVTYSMTDCNGHLNNVNYPNLLCDFVPNIADMATVGVTLHYQNEAKLGSRVDVYVSNKHQEGNNIKYYVKSMVDGKANVVAEFNFCNK